MIKNRLRDCEAYFCLSLGILKKQNPERSKKGERYLLFLLLFKEEGNRLRWMRDLNVLFCYLSFEALAHEATNFLSRQIFTHEVHEFCERSFNRRILAAYNAGLKQLQSCLIKLHMYASTGALGDIDDDFAFCCGF